MDYENKSQTDKCAILEHAVLTSSPEELSALYRQLGQIQMSARALGFACRFRGLAHVRALVESGACAAEGEMRLSALPVETEAAAHDDHADHAARNN